MTLGRIRVGVAVLAVVMLFACVSKNTVKERSLYQRLGGKGAIVAVVDDFAGNVVTDPRINLHFSDTERLKKMLVEQICQVSGGPCVYGGLDMKTAHLTRNISEAGFDAWMENLIKTLDKFRVPDKEKKEFLAILGAMRKDIVTTSFTK